ncbi:MAG: undecaprenyldiphospho-muramoylpentapeptide beta-N-acetylglucosaminyltransferase [Clostridia bacterium]|nr:undecaprenyldiphospho-muramoylpentapeptide beta-N-acetylglucosaminyltransferase [Clostridia bacterium]
MLMLMCCGGTGGHIYPAIAIAQTMQELIPDLEIRFVGGTGGFDEDLICREGYPFHGIKISGYNRSWRPKAILSNIKTSIQAFTSVKTAKRLLADLKPDLVVGTGGYACWPALKAAARMGIPCAVHESNVNPGLAVRMLLKKMDRVFVNFEETVQALKGRSNVERVGMPVRRTFSKIDRVEARQTLGLRDDQKLIVSFGGSGGAEYLNEAVIRMMDLFSSRHSEIVHVHSAGKRNGVYEDAKNTFDRFGLGQHSNVMLKPFIYDMPVQMAAADLVICRAGAMTISELALLGKSAILVPSPYVAGQHQYKNAMALADRGAAKVLFNEDETRFTGEEFASLAEQLIGDSSLREEMSQKIKEFALPDANARIAQELKKLLQGDE